MEITITSEDIRAVKKLVKVVAFTAENPDLAKQIVENTVEEIKSAPQQIKAFAQEVESAYTANLESVDWHKATELNSQQKEKFIQIMKKHISGKIIWAAIVILALCAAIPVFLHWLGISFTHNAPANGIVIMIIIALVMGGLLFAFVVGVKKSIERIQNVKAGDFLVGYGTVTEIRREVSYERDDEGRQRERISYSVIVNGLKADTYKSNYKHFQPGEEVVLLRVGDWRTGAEILALPNNKRL